MVQRYGFDALGEAFMKQDDGRYVFYSDYAALEKRCGELERQLKVACYFNYLDTKEQFDWAILTKIDDLEAENAELKEKNKGLEFLADKALNPSRYGGKR